MFDRILWTRAAMRDARGIVHASPVSTRVGAPAPDPNADYLPTSNAGMWEVGALVYGPPVVGGLVGYLYAGSVAGIAAGFTLGTLVGIGVFWWGFTSSTEM